MLTPLLETKYNEAFDNMVVKDVSQRPTCEEILKKKDLWVLKEEEFEINKKLKKIIDSKVRKNKLTVYSMLRSKMISDKAIKSKSKLQYNH
jgi:hypothetical protein